MKKTRLLLLPVAGLLIFALTGCGEENKTSDTNVATPSDGKDGATPVIGSNGNWWINGTDTGVSAKGKDATSVYRVTFYDGDQVTPLYSTEVSEGKTVVYIGKTPTKEGTESISYAFSGWDKDLTNVSSDMSVYPLFEEAKAKYAITFINDDGTILDTQLVEYGKTPSAPSPSKDGDGVRVYTFAGWDRPIAAVTGEATYKATYTQDYEEDYYTNGLDFRFNDYRDGFEVYAYRGEEKEVVVPATFLNMPVTSITKDAFQGNNEVTSVHIGANVYEIEDAAFAKMPNLQGFSVAKSQRYFAVGKVNELLRIRQRVFTDIDYQSVWTDDTTVSLFALPATYNGLYRYGSEVETTVDGALSLSHAYILEGPAKVFGSNGRFYRAFGSKMKDISPDIHHIIVSGGGIATAPFAPFTNIESFTLLENEDDPIETIGKYAFYDVGATSITLPNSVIEIKGHALAENPHLRKLIIGSNHQSKLEIVRPSALLGTGNISEGIHDNGEIKFIGNGVKEVDTDFQDLIAYKLDDDAYSYPTLPTATVAIADDFAKYDSNIAGFQMYDWYSDYHLKSIGNNAFWYAVSFSWTLPSSVTYIGDDALRGTAAVKTENVSGYNCQVIKAYKDGVHGDQVDGYLLDGPTSGTISSFTIPSTVRGLGINFRKNSCFGNSKTEFMLNNSNPYLTCEYNTIYDDEDTAILYCNLSATSISGYQYARAKVIGSYCFYNTHCDYFLLSDRLEEIGEMAFSNTGYRLRQTGYASLLNVFSLAFHAPYWYSTTTLFFPTSMVNVGEMIFLHAGLQDSNYFTIKIEDDEMPSYFASEELMGTNDDRTDPCTGRPTFRYGQTFED